MENQIKTRSLSVTGPRAPGVPPHNPTSLSGTQFMWADSANFHTCGNEIHHMKKG